MARPVDIPVWWVEKLYGPQLSARLEALFAQRPDLAAVVNHASGYPSTDGLYREAYHLTGPEVLLGKKDGARLAKSGDVLPNPLAGVDGDEHLYRHSVWTCEEQGLCWRLFLRPGIVFVLPASSGQRTKFHLENNAVALIQKPSSAHGRLELTPRLRTLGGEASDLLRYIWPGGVVLDDHEGILPEDGCLAL